MKSIWIIRALFIACVTFLIISLKGDYEQLQEIDNYCQNKIKAKTLKSIQGMEILRNVEQCKIWEIVPMFRQSQKISRGSMLLQGVGERDCRSILSGNNAQRSKIKSLILYNNENELKEMLSNLGCLNYIDQIGFQSIESQEKIKIKVNTTEIIAILKWKGFANISKFNTGFFDLLSSALQSKHPPFSINYSTYNLFVGKLYSQQSAILPIIIKSIAPSQKSTTFILDITDLNEDLAFLLSQIEADLSNSLGEESSYSMDIFSREKQNKLWIKIMIYHQGNSAPLDQNIKIKSELTKTVFELSDKVRYISKNEDNHKDSQFTQLRNHQRNLIINNRHNILVSDFQNISQLETYERVLFKIINTMKKQIKKNDLLIKIYLSQGHLGHSSLPSQMLIFLARSLLSEKKQKVSKLGILTDCSEILGVQKIRKNFKILQSFQKQTILNDIDGAFQVIFISLSTLSSTLPFHITLPKSQVGMIPLKLANILLISLPNSESQMKNILGALENRKKEHTSEFRVICPMFNYEDIQVAKNLVKIYRKSNFTCEIVDIQTQTSQYINQQTDFVLGFLIIHSNKTFMPVHTVLRTSNEEVPEKLKPIQENPLLKYIQGFKMTQFLHSPRWFYQSSFGVQNQLFLKILDEIFKQSLRKSRDCHRVINLEKSFNKSIILLNESIYLSNDKQPEENGVDSQELKSIYLSVNTGDKIIVDVYDEILLFVLGNRVGFEGSIFLGEHVENREQLYRFAVINDLWGIIPEEKDQNEVKFIFTVPERRSLFQGNQKIYVLKNEASEKLEQKCKPIQNSTFSKWSLCS